MRGDRERYFLGSVVLVKQKGQAHSEVIDGQQRLTTLTILLAVLRDLTDDPGLRADIEPFIAEPGSRVRELTAKPRLTLRPRDNEFFSTWVQTTGPIAELLALKPDALATDAQRAVQANSAAIREVLAEWTEEQRLSLLTMLFVRRPGESFDVFCRVSSAVVSGC